MPRPTDDAVLTRVIAAPWGPVHVAASERGIVAVEQADDRRRVRGDAPDAAPSAGPGRGRRRRDRRRPAGRPPRPRDGRRSTPCSPAAGPTRTCRSTCPTGRPGTRRSSTPSGPSRGARPPATARSRGGSVRPARPGPSVAPSAAIRSSLLVPCHRVIAARRDARRVRRRRLGRPDGGPRSEARAARARGRQRAGTRPLDSAEMRGRRPAPTALQEDA